MGQERDDEIWPSASPSDHTAGPSSTMSFRRNWPGIPESAGNPPVVGSQPGVDRMKLRVVRNIGTASALPTAAIAANTGRSAIMIAMAISKVPRRSENLWTLKTP